MYFQKLGTGKPVVFLHGWGADGSIFLPVARQTNCRCYLVDFNGFGKSPSPPPVGWTVEDYAEALYNFFRLHNLTNVCLVAHSFGCRVAMVFAAKHPTRVNRMLLVAPAGLRSFNLKRWCKVRLYKFRKLLGLSPRTDFASHDYLACPPRLKNTFVKVINQDLSQFARNVTCPVLIVNGRTDTETPLKHAQRLQKLISDSTLSVIDGGHFAFFANPAAFAKTIGYFMEDPS